jgi:hypothetical protein
MGKLYFAYATRGNAMREPKTSAKAVGKWWDMG